ncbi:MAG: hypothetical protein ACREC5_03785 [Thermoplasmata archaeon]
MIRLGSLLAFWSNARCAWFPERVVSGMNVWVALARQNPEEGRRRSLALPKEGRRPRVELARGKVEERSEAKVKLAIGDGSIQAVLAEWAASVRALPREGVSRGRLLPTMVDGRLRGAKAYLRATLGDAHVGR